MAKHPKEALFSMLATEDIKLDDEGARKDRDKVMKKQKINALFYSVSDTFKFLAGTCTAIGMAMFVPVLTGGTTAAASGIAGGLIAKIGEVGLLSALGALTGPGAAGLAIIGAAAACTAVAVGATYVASRMFNSANLDATELNAKHTAKYLVKELKQEAACVQEYPQNERADGRQWGDVVKTHAAREAAVAANPASLPSFPG